MGQTKIDRTNRVSFTDADLINRFPCTEADFMDHDGRRGRHFATSRDEEPVPPADRNVFDEPLDDGRAYAFDNLRLSSLDWTNETFPTGVPISPSIFEDDVVRVPGLDSELNWSRQNPTATLHSIGQSTLEIAGSGGGASIHGSQRSILEEIKRMTHHQSTTKSRAKYWIAESEITDADVICERGGKSNRHAGTKKYRGMIEKFKPTYQSMTKKIAKTNLSRDIISQIQDSDGRFLKKDEKTSQYFVISKVDTTKKVSQALREKKVLKWTEDL